MKHAAPLIALLLTITAPVPGALAEGLKPCRVDGKLVFSRECLLQQKQAGSSTLGDSPAARTGQEPANQPEKATVDLTPDRPPAAPAPDPAAPIRQPEPNAASADPTPESQAPAADGGTSAATTTEPESTLRRNPPELPRTQSGPADATENAPEPRGAPTAPAREGVDTPEAPPTEKSRAAAIAARKAALEAIRAAREARRKALEATRSAEPLPPPVEAESAEQERELPPPKDDPTAASSPACQNEPLIRAVRDDDIAALRACASYQRLHEARDARGRSLLHLAAVRGALKSLGYLLQTGADAELRSRIDRGGTALHAAAAADQAAAIRILHQQGANLEARDYLKRTPLIAAVNRGAERAVAMLIRLRADLDAVDRAGQSALINASQRVDGAGMIRQLLQAGANPDQKDNRGRTALHYAVLTDTANLRELIAGDADLDARDNEGRTALLLAADDDLQRHRERILLLMDAGANINKADHDGLTLLEIAYREQDEPLIKALLARGVNTRKLARIIERWGTPAEAKQPSDYD